MCSVKLNSMSSSSDSRRIFIISMAGEWHNHAPLLSEHGSVWWALIFVNWYCIHSFQCRDIVFLLNSFIMDTPLSQIFLPLYILVLLICQIILYFYLESFFGLDMIDDDKNNLMDDHCLVDFMDNLNTLMLSCIKRENSFYCTNQVNTFFKILIFFYV